MGRRFTTSEARIVDQHGRPYLVQNATHDVATQSPRWGGMYAPDIGPNAANIPDLPTARMRCRSVERSHGMIARGLRILCANIVGTGIKPQSLIPDNGHRTSVQGAFSDWADVAMADGRTDYYGGQNLGVRHMVLDGEGLARFVDQPAGTLAFGGMPLDVPLQLQILAPDLLSTTFNTVAPNGNRIRASIETDKASGQITAYHVLRAHPSDAAMWADTDLLKTERIPAEDIIHLFHCESAGQMRGWPFFTRAVMTAHTKGLTFDAALQRMAVACMYAAFITGSEDEEVTARPTLEPGTVAKLRQGEAITFPNVPDMGARLEEFLHWLHLEMASGTLNSFEELTGDLSQVNYSSIRAGIIMMNMLIAQIQHFTVNPLFNRRVWARWLPKAVLAGATTIPTRTFLANRAAYSRVKWIPPARPWVDPLKEVQADILACRANFRSIPSVIIEKFGEDPEQTLDEITRYQALLDAAGVASDADGRRPAKGGPIPPDPTAVDEPPAPKKRRATGARARKEAMNA